ncbi:MAG: hypothetical protein F6K19_39830 [Cyanothece sp. SIO1E1]|nr:hypothetical protein [Cyanothece sp. SIO1E1]
MMNAGEPSGNRLDRIEALVEANARQIGENNQTILQIAGYQTSLFRGFGEMAQVIRGLTGQVNNLTSTVGNLTNTVENLTNTVENLAGRFDSLTEKVDSLAASAAQHDRILDYLLRRDRDGEQ